MRKALFLIMAMLLMFSLFAVPISAAKPANAGAQTYSWYLSGDVMPVPPYGSRDIPGSDTASKLIVNQPNGNTVVTMTGVMKGLNSNTTYTVYLSKGYTSYTPTSIRTETWVWNVLGTYFHDVTITQQNPDGTFSGTAGYPSDDAPWDQPNETTETITGQIVGNTFYMTTVYHGPYNPGYTVTAVGTIQSDGSIIGTTPWSWSAPEGTVTLAAGSTGWPGLFTSTVQPFTFVTDEYGAGSWHVNLTDADLPGSESSYKLSVWINEAGATMLISDTFEVTKG
ncbi:MAG: hypothetical protein ABIG40_02355 [Parcubacteria group bacterium]